jgi:glyceraldehyde-3-phosphate dehydrogenase (NAD(P))
MYEVGLFEETVGMSGNDLMFAINIPQESVVIPETIDGIRAALEMQTDGLEALGLTNKYLGMS